MNTRKVAWMGNIDIAPETISITNGQLLELAIDVQEETFLVCWSGRRLYCGCSLKAHTSLNNFCPRLNTNLRFIGVAHWKFYFQSRVFKNYRRPHFVNTIFCFVCPHTRSPEYPLWCKRRQWVGGNRCGMMHDALRWDNLMMMACGYVHMGVMMACMGGWLQGHVTRR